MTSHASRQPALRPVVSLPVTTSVGPVRSCAASSTSPCSSVPSTVSGTPEERCAATQSRTSRPAGTRTVGTEKIEPVLARTARGSYGSAACPATTSPLPPNASSDRATVPTLPGLVGRSSTTPRKSALTVPPPIRPRSSGGVATTARSSGVSSSLPPSSRRSADDTANRCARTRSSIAWAHDDSDRSASTSHVRTVHPDSTASVMGRTPWTTISPARCRFVRLVSRASHCWNAALRVVTRCTLRPPGRWSGRTSWSRRAGGRRSGREARRRRPPARRARPPRRRASSPRG